MITGALIQAVGDTLSGAGISSDIQSVTTLYGGDINCAAKVTTSTDTFFVKWNEKPPPGFFEAEVHGLNQLREMGCIRVPEPIVAGLIADGEAAFLILEYIDPGVKNDAAAEELGRQLAQLHCSHPAKIYGLDQPNYLGRLPQPNPPNRSWLAFYRDDRLGWQRDIAAQNGHLPSHRAKSLANVMDNLNRWIDDSQCTASLLHGDLWGGNWMVASTGEPVIFDPAIVHGDSELDMAMTKLFGGFPPAFYRAYAEVKPDRPGHQDRVPLYQLYYLMSHLNLFGESYGPQVDNILSQLQS